MLLELPPLPSFTLPPLPMRSSLWHPISVTPVRAGLYQLGAVERAREFAGHTRSYEAYCYELGYATPAEQRDEERGIALYRNWIVGKRTEWMNDDAIDAAFEDWLFPHHAIVNLDVLCEFDGAQWLTCGAYEADYWRGLVE